MNINEEKRNQWQALKGMGFKAHWDYFWDYYKIHVIVGVIALATIISLVHDITSQKPYALSATFVNTASMEEPDTLIAGFAEYEGIDTTKFNISIDASSTIDMQNPDQYTIANSERIYAMIAAKDLDLIMADETIFDNYSKNEMFVDLREYFTESELNALGDLVFYVDPAQYHSNQPYSELENDALNPESSKKEDLPVSDPSELIPVGIILKDNPHLTAISYYPGQAPIIGLATASERSETAADFIRYLLK
ncbi:MULTISPECIES: hypothetical protein [unclassified Butyrivibrio]|uniref:hypothetical protein n=1 Tax=unclassified Butyrivibrio TaxID=2639466 RepID=UPI000420C027|nr:MULTISPECIES: hypothetical protein [unclassified Butyrivibrio]